MSIVTRSEVETSHVAVSCRHCGQPVPAGLLPKAGSDEPAYCCNGCRAAAALLSDAGLDAFYDYRGNEPAAAGLRADSGETFEEFDDPVFEQLHVRPLGERTRRVELAIEGLHCRACVWLLEQLPRLEPSVLESRLSLHRSSLTVIWDRTAAPLSRIARTLDRLGYRPHPREASADDEAERLENRRRLTDIAVAAAVSGNLMLIAIALYAGWWQGMDAYVTHYFRWISAGLGAVALAWPGRTFFRQAWLGVRMRVPNMDLPIAVGLGLGTIVGLINAIRGAGEIYFDSLGMLVFLLLVGRWIQYRQTRSAARHIRQLYEITPRRARRLSDDGSVRWVPVAALAVGDRIRVLAAETVPADGIVRAGTSTTDRSLLTGEATPVATAIGDEVLGGMNNLEGPLDIEVTAIGDQSRLGKLIDLIEDAALRRTPIVQQADALGGWFVVGIVVATAATALGWYLAGSPAYLDHAIALAIVACPCALGLATPLAIAVAIGRAARQGLLVKGGDTLERLARPGILWLDKTGTLTEGRARVVSWVGDRSTIDAVATLERGSAHPIARAIVAYAEAHRGSAASDAASCEAHQAETGGISGRFAGSDYRVGNRAFVAPADSLDERWRRWTERTARHGATPILVARDGKVVAGIALGDAIRSDADAVLRRLERRGWRLGILSGDHPQVVAHVASRLGIPAERALGGLSPEAKVERVARIDPAAPDAVRVMVGDGMNDGAALAAADVGVSMHAGAEISLETADVHLGREGLAPLLDLLVGSGATVRTIRIGLSVSLAYNLVAVALAASGLINPLVAAALMPASSLTVLLLAVSGGAFRRRPTETCPIALRASRTEDSTFVPFAPAGASSGG